MQAGLEFEGDGDGDAKNLLYEAYNELRSLVGDLAGGGVGLESPAVVVVGHQTDGKSALVEALMGFQFNHVGGGTKTRRPVELHLRYNPRCTSPVCRLRRDEGDVALPLADVQAYIESENMRLESEACQFSSREIIITVEYKDCPNLIIIDTPGLILPSPGQKYHLQQNQANAVEALVRAKIQHKESIILCLEDCSDWSNATTRRLVMQIDPELSRTVLVSTKLDTKILQFARASDVELFLQPPASVLDCCLLGDSPFFTSVPAGRVGSGCEDVFRSDKEFQKAILLRELEDIASLEEKLGRSLRKTEKKRIGISNLRSFLEEVLKRRYIESVPQIVPLLEKEYRNKKRNLQEVSKELSNLDKTKLKEKASMFHNSFLTKLSLLLKGSVLAPPDKFGETLQGERITGGTFTGSENFQLPHKLIPNAGLRLYGGAQYHRAMAEFRLLVGNTKCPTITREEIVNACGVEDIHDGTNYSRTACVIAVAKARETFEPFLHQLGCRLLHILKRLFQISVYLLQKDGDHLAGHELILKRAEAAFYKCTESSEQKCRDKCMEDLESTTRYVTWSLHNKNRAGLHHFLESFAANDHYPSGHALHPSTQQQDPFGGLNNSKHEKIKSVSAMDLSSPSPSEMRLVDLLDNTLWNRKLAPSSERFVYALVCQIFHGVKDHFLLTTELKFNCFLLMPMVDKLPELLREDLEFAFDGDLDSIFDVAQLQQSLSQRKRELEIELKRIMHLKEKFQVISDKLNSFTKQL